MSTVLAVMAVLVAAPWRPGRPRMGRRFSPADPSADLVLLADLVGLGLLAGMPFPSALAASARHVDPALGRVITQVVRAARLDGSTVTFAAAEGPPARLLALAARAAITGAPLVAAVAAFADEARSAARSRHLGDARRLSVRLLFPLALLILPGFVLLVAGPVVLDSLARLDL